MATIEIQGLTQVALPVEDVERAKTFYRDRLGLTHLFDAPPGLSFLACGETRLMLSRPEGPGAARPLLYYGVENAAAAHAKLAAEGVSFVEPARCIAQVGDRNVWLAIGEDGEGNMFGLMSEQEA
jgi:methylmalonyl-CoA/ethylmalonyl-CoA epimerase